MDTAESVCVRDAQVRRIADGLKDLIALRATALAPLDGIEGPPATPGNVRTATLAAIVELVELLQEIPWKSWAKPKSIDTQKVVHEFADVLAFISLLMNYLEKLADITPEDLAAAYADKMDIVNQRMLGNVEGYVAQLEEQAE